MEKENCIVKPDPGSLPGIPLTHSPGHHQLSFSLECSEESLEFQEFCVGGCGTEVSNSQYCMKTHCPDQTWDYKQFETDNFNKAWKTGKAGSRSYVEVAREGAKRNPVQ